MSEPATVTSNGSAASAEPTSPTAVVEAFLHRLAADDIAGAARLLHDDVAYTNVSLPTINGRRAVERVAQATLGRDVAGFEVYFHAISEEDGVVLTERTDVLLVGPLRAQFWVCGRFEVVDGRITVWRDYFDYLNLTVALLRGLVGIALPALRARPPR